MGGTAHGQNYNSRKRVTGVCLQTRENVQDQRVQKRIYIVIKTVNPSSISSSSYLPVLALLWDIHVQKAKVRQELLIEQTRQQVCH